MLKRAALSAIPIAAITLVTWGVNEGWMGTAKIPTKDDRCTNGFGSTFDEQGNPIKCGEKVDPVTALRRAYVLMDQKRKTLEKCVTGPVSDVEAQLLDDFAGQYGESATCKSSMVKFINQGKYKEACEAYAAYKFAAKRDCSKPENWGPLGCKGVWTRSIARRNTCLESLIPESAPALDPGNVASSGSGPTKEN